MVCGVVACEVVVCGVVACGAKVCGVVVCGVVACDVVARSDSLKTYNTTALVISRFKGYFLFFFFKRSTVVLPT